MKAEHRGFTIEFDPIDEQWKCGDLALADVSLKKLKSKIDAASKERRTVSVPALYLDTRWRRRGPDVVVLKQVTVTLLRHGDRKCDIRIGKDRKEIDIDELYSLDQREKLEAYVAAQEAERRAGNLSERLRDGLVKLTAADIREAAVRTAEENAP